MDSLHGDWTIVFRKTFEARLGNIPGTAWSEWVTSLRSMDKSKFDEVINILVLKFHDPSIDPGQRRNPKLGDFERVYRSLTGNQDIIHEFKNCGWCGNEGHTHVVYGGFSVDTKPVPHRKMNGELFFINLPIMEPVLVPCSCDRGLYMASTYDHFKMSPENHKKLLKNSAFDCYEMANQFIETCRKLEPAKMDDVPYFNPAKGKSKIDQQYCKHVMVEYQEKGKEKKVCTRCGWVAVGAKAIDMAGIIDPSEPKER